MNERFQLSLWDKDGFIQQAVLPYATEVRVVEEINEIDRLTFLYPMHDKASLLLEEGKIVRLEDKSLGSESYRVVGVSSNYNTISLDGASGIQIGNFLQFYETPYQSFVATCQTQSDAGSDVTLTLSTTTGLSTGDYLSVQDTSAKYILKVKSVAGNAITVDLPYAITTDAVLSKPGRSFIARILNLKNASTTLTANVSATPGYAVLDVASVAGFEEGDYLTIKDGDNTESSLIYSISSSTNQITVVSLSYSHNAGTTVIDASITPSRMDFEPQTSSPVRKVNFRSFRIQRLEHQRRDDVPFISIECSGLEADLKRALYLSSLNNSYVAKDVAQESKERTETSIKQVWDDIFQPLLDENGKPKSLDTFISGYFLLKEYAQGTISVTKGSNVVTGTDTAFLTERVQSGSLLSIEGDRNLYTVAYASNETRLILTSNVSRESGSNLTYRLFIKGWPNFTENEISTTGSVFQGNTMVIISSGTISDGKLSIGTQVQIANDPKLYYLDRVSGSAVLYLTDPVERSDGSDIRIIFRQDRRQFEVPSGGVSLLTVLKSLVERWSDSKQTFWFRINEDRSVDLFYKPLIDSRDPTVKLPIRYSKNLAALSREILYRDKANVLILRGKTDDWQRYYFTGVTYSVIEARREEIFLAQGYNARFHVNDVILIIEPSDTLTITSTSAYTATDSSATLDNNRYRHAIAIVDSGDGQGQIRTVSSNSGTTIIVSKQWDILPENGTIQLVDRNKFTTHILGFGVRTFRASSITYTTNAATIANIDTTSLPWSYFVRGCYRGGVLEVLSRDTRSRRYEIADADLSGTDLTITIDGTFDVIPDSTDSIRISAPSCVVEEYTSGTVFGSNYVLVDPVAAGYPNWAADLWNGAELYITSGNGKSLSYYNVTGTTLESGTQWRLTISGSFSPIPTDGSKILLRKTHNLGITLSSRLDWSPTSTARIYQLFDKNLPLTLGRAHKYRSLIVSATEDQIQVLSGEGSKFSAGDVIFVGCKNQTDSEYHYRLRRGDLLNGQIVEISSVSGDVLTIATKLNPIPVTGNHVELISIKDNLDIAKHGRVEMLYEDTEAINPFQLKERAERKLYESTTIIPSYSLSFLDLNQLDRQTYANIVVNLGDTLRVIDEDLNIDVSNLRVISKEWKPETPADVRVQLADLVADQIRAQVSLEEKVHALERRIIRFPSYVKEPAPCVFWRGGTCTKPNPPNTFCLTDLSNHDGIYTAQLEPITRFHCASYTTIDSFGLSVDERNMFYATSGVIQNVNNNAWDSTHISIITTDFVVSDKSSVFIIGIWNSLSGSKREEDDAEVRIQPISETPTFGVKPADMDSGFGCIVQARRAAGVTDTLDVMFQVILIGEKSAQ